MLGCATGAGRRSLLATFVVKGQAERSDILGDTLPSDIAASQAASAAAMPSEDLLAPRVRLVLPQEQHQDDVNIFLSLRQPPSAAPASVAALPPAPSALPPAPSAAPPSVAALPSAPSQLVAPDSPTQVEPHLLPCGDEEQVDEEKDGEDQVDEEDREEQPDHEDGQKRNSTIGTKDQSTTLLVCWSPSRPALPSYATYCAC